MLSYLFKIFLRNFQRQKAYTIINVFGLSLGFAVVLVIGFWIRFHLNFNQKIENAENIYRIVQRINDGNESELISLTPGPLAETLSDNYPEIIHATKVHYGPDLVMQTEEEAFVEEKVLYVDSSFYQIFNLPYLYGQDPQDFENSIIMTESIARKYFGSSETVGNTINTAGGDNFTVRGVIENLPDNIHFDFNIVLPISFAISRGAEVFPEEWYRFAEVETYIETLPNTNIHSLNSKIRYLKAEFSEYKDDEIIIQPIRNIHLDHGIRYNVAHTIPSSTLVTYAIIAILLLSIACLNYIILTVGLSVRRIKSAGIQIIHGASRYQVILGVIFESILLTLLALAISFILIEVFSPVISLLMDFNISLEDEFSGNLFITCLSAALIIGILNGIYPAILLSDINPSIIFKSQSSNRVSKLKVLRSLIVIQFSIGLILLIYSGVIGNQLKYMILKDPGFDRHNLISITIYDESKKRLFNNYDQITDALSKINGISNVSISCSSPSQVNTSAGLARWEGQKADQNVYVQWNSIFFNYFETIGVPVLYGRDFSDYNENDITLNGQSKYILNESALESMGLTANDAIGRNFTLYEKTGPIIGVVKDFHFKALNETINPMAFSIIPYAFREFLIRSESGFSPELIQEVKNIWKEYLPDDPFNFVSVSTTYQNVYQSEKNLLSYNRLLATLIILVSSLGFSGLAFLVLDQKTKELGIRKIHGASVFNVVHHLLSIFTKWILAAVIISIPVAYALSIKWLENYAYKTTMGYKIFLFPILIIFLISFTGIIYRVIQSSMKNPVDSIKYE